MVQSYLEFCCDHLLRRGYACDRGHADGGAAAYYCCQFQASLSLLDLLHPLPHLLLWNICEMVVQRVHYENDHD